MECTVEYTEEFETWWDTLSVGEQEAVATKVELLERHGPGLRRPHSGQIDGSKHPNMKELVVQYAGDPYRVLYAFDPIRCAVLLIGGKKTGKDRWYEKYIPMADAIFDAHLAELKREKEAEEKREKEEEQRG